MKSITFSHIISPEYFKGNLLPEGVKARVSCDVDGAGNVSDLHISLPADWLEHVSDWSTVVMEIEEAAEHMAHVQYMTGGLVDHSEVDYQRIVEAEMQPA